MSEIRLTLDDALEMAVKHHQAGNHLIAQNICRQILAVDPRQADALHVMGVSLGETGDVAAAIQHIQQAVAIDPAFIGAHRSLGRFWGELGKSEQAIGCYRRIILLAPDDAGAWRGLGIELRKSDLIDEAISSLKKAIALDGGQAETHSELGIALGEQGQWEAAEAEHWRAIELEPRNPKWQLPIGDLHRAHGKPAAAIFVYSEAIKASPNYAAAYNARAVALRDHMLLEDAIRDHRRAVELAPLITEFQFEMATTLSAGGDIDQARATCQRVLELDRQSARGWECLGRILQTHGRFEESAEAFARSIEIQPNAAVAMQMVVIRKPPTAIEIGELRRQFDDAEIEVKQRVSAGFALGKMLDESDQFDDAFSAFSRANSLFLEGSAKQGRRFDFNELKARVDELIGVFGADYFKSRAGWGAASEKPVFVVGMPRSGTTLVEQIAATHSAVMGAGERFDIAMIRSRLSSKEHGDSPAHWQEQEIAREANSHLEILDRLGKGAARVIDKMPANLLDLGLIATLFPQARVIFCQREARDNCLSCYFQHFGNNNQMFSYDLGDCGRQFNEYQRMSEHWREVLPMRKLFVQYEDLVADPTVQSRRLIEFLGLEWEPECLNFYQHERPVLTASVWQVRQPIYTRSVGRWKHYEKFLGPLRGIGDLNRLARESGSE